MGLFKTIFNLTRKPEGFWGGRLLTGMNHAHAKGADWGMSNLPAINPAEIADLGCGGGRNAAVLLKKYPSARLTAVDYSPLCVDRTRKYNAKAVAAGRCTALECSVSALTLAAQSCDLATAFETIYFWPGLDACFAEVFRVLKPGGLFLIVNESDGTDSAGLKWEKIIDGIRLYTAEEIQLALKQAGFSQVQAFHHDSRPWLAILAEK